ncbi:hypothetical protein NXF25_011733 [Crotalus adamanteus]|uniref:Lamina-associated polypeptide 2 alpha C-terminal domain-containing protein n=1 Tax=Crotalus adamanteus TaxID=8729 RepID=A0AAW1BGB2_CROAD
MAEKGSEPAKRSRQSEASGKSTTKRARPSREPQREEGCQRLRVASPDLTGTMGRSIFEPLSSHSASAPGAWSPPRGIPESDSNLTVASGRGITGQDTSGPQATFTPTAAGLRPPENQALNPNLLQSMIAQAVAQFMASNTPQPPPQATHHSQSPDWMDDPASDLESTGAEQAGLILSEDEGIAPYEPTPPVGLFDHSFFNSLLLKACTTANLAQEQENPPISQGPHAIYTEPSVSQNHIPCPPLFLNIVQKQWEKLGSPLSPGAVERTLFNVAPSLTSLLEIPEIDEPLNSLFPKSNIPGDINEALRAEDKKIESALRRSHQASAWATRAATSMAFFARASVLWLRELQDMIPPDQLRAHQNLGKLVATSQYLADASLHTIRYTARTIAADISARRLLWLRNWRADTKAKWHLASKPYTGGQLFGKALEPYLTEGKDKRKTLVNTSRRGDRRWGNLSQSNYRRQSFRTAPAWDWAQAPRPSFQRQERQQDRSAYRGRSQFQTKRSFRGAGSRSFKRGK